MIASLARVRALILVVTFALAATAVVAQNTVAGGKIPNECCPEPSALFYDGGWYGDYLDAGVGETDVTTYGTAERRIPMPAVRTGLKGVADLYHRWMTFDVTLPTWTQASVVIKGGGIPAPTSNPANLYVPNEPNLVGKQLQPRPGIMPGLYLYTENVDAGADAVFYHYGGPLETGPNPQTTAIYSGGSQYTGGGGGDGGQMSEGGTAVASSAPQFATWIFTNNLSGAQLWHYEDATQPYYEIKHVDGTIARFDIFVAWSSTYSSQNPGHALLRLTSVRDPYDNVASYTYDHANRLEQIEFQSGLRQHFDWDADWQWATSHDYVDVSYDQLRSGSYVGLPDLLWGMAFHDDPMRGRLTGSRLAAIYSGKRDFAVDASGAPYSGAPTTRNGRVLHSLLYNSGTATLTERQQVSTQGFVQFPTDPVGISFLDTVETTFLAGSSRVSKQVRPITQEELDFTYPTTGLRATELLDPGITVVSSIQVEDQSGTKRWLQIDHAKGHLYSVIVTPSLDYTGRPRATHLGTENSAIFGAASDVEPTAYEVYNVYDSTCACQKPIRREIRPTLGSPAPDPRIFHFEYDSDTKLLIKRMEPNPQAGSGSFPDFVTWEWSYAQSLAPSGKWGAWLLQQEKTPDGDFDYAYSEWFARADAVNHGQVPAKVTRTLSEVRTQPTLSGATATSTVDISETVWRSLPGQTYLPPTTTSPRGQVRCVSDGDGIATNYLYSNEGWLTLVQKTGADTTEYAHNDYGETTSVTQNLNAANHEATWAVVPVNSIGAAASRSSTSAAANRESQYYYDRFGHLVCHRRLNKSSSNGAPQKYAATASSAREYVDTQWHYLHTRIAEVYRDRKPLDEAAGGSQYLVSSFQYSTTTSRLEYIVNPNGSKTYYDFDGYGTLYRTYTKDPTGAETVRGPKMFISPFLEVTGSYEFDDTDHLWTLIARNHAGSIIQVTEPATTAPLGYTPNAGVSYSTGGAKHYYEVDQMGRVTKTETDDGSAILARSFMRYDELSRQIWQHDEAKTRVNNSVSNVGDHYTAWEYSPGKASQLQRAMRTGVDDTLYTYTTAGFIDRVTQDGDYVDYGYHSGTSFIATIDRMDADPLTTSRATSTEYVVDPFGQITSVVEVDINQEPYQQTLQDLTHQYAYNSFGRVDKYTDPAGLVQKFLPDALGRVVEHVRVGSAREIINSAAFTDMGVADGRTRTERMDDHGQATRTDFDFAGRPLLVMNPGADTAPSGGSAAAKHQKFSVFAEYDGASRVKALYDGDYGKTNFERDGAGRVIMRYLEDLSVSVGGASSIEDSNISHWNTRDFMRRDALGRIQFHDYYAHPDGIVNMGVGATTQDSIGRVHNEAYIFLVSTDNGPAYTKNVLDVRSTFTGGNPYRDKLEYLDGLDGGTGNATIDLLHAFYEHKLELNFTHDNRGRLDQVSWDNSQDGTGALSLIADYGWAGGLRRTRSMFLGGVENPQYDSEFTFDDFNRLIEIKDTFSDDVVTNNGVRSQFEYEYDAASNLTKERYTKVDNSLGDRFAYDEYHRLTDAWMGIKTTTEMNASGNPAQFDSSKMRKYLTYGLDDANNRTTTSSETDAGKLEQAYEKQDGSSPQGPSNRYASVSQPAVGNTGAVVPFEYDNRGNLICDGQFVYQYGVSNLNAVYRIVPTEAVSSGGGESAESLSGEQSSSQSLATSSPSGGGTALYGAVEQGALQSAANKIGQDIPNFYKRLIREHKNPVFRARLRKTINGGVVRMNAPSGGGMPGFVPVEATLELAAVYIYDCYNRRTMSIIVGEEDLLHTYDGWREVAEYGHVQNWAVPQKQFVWGARLDGLARCRIKQDLLGGPSSWQEFGLLHGKHDKVAMLVDDDGDIVEQYEYDPYGRVTVYDGAGVLVDLGAAGVSPEDGTYSKVGLPILWNGLRLDHSTGLICMRTRFYDPALGRFLSVDRLGVWGDEVGFGNGYGYAAGNPCTLSDPFGLCAGAGPCDKLRDEVEELAKKLAAAKAKVESFEIAVQELMEKLAGQDLELNKKIGAMNRNANGLPMFDLSGTRNGISDGVQSMSGHAFNINDRYRGRNKTLGNLRAAKNRLAKAGKKVAALEGELATATAALLACEARCRARNLLRRGRGARPGVGGLGGSGRVPGSPGGGGGGGGGRGGWGGLKLGALFLVKDCSIPPEERGPWWQELIDCMGVKHVPSHEERMRRLAMRGLPLKNYGGP